MHSIIIFIEENTLYSVFDAPTITPTYSQNNVSGKNNSNIRFVSLLIKTTM